VSVRRRDTIRGVAFELDQDLPAPLYPLAWLIGSWAGVGVIGYPPVIDEAQFGQEVEFSHDGRPFLSYRSTTWLLDDDGNQVRPLTSESGYWRPLAERDDEATELEVMIAHPTGVVELYIGAVKGPRIDLATDAVVRSATAEEYSAATRLYGLVEGDLLWAYDIAALGQPIKSYASARLKRL
jgi:hypothetical protein